MDADTLLIDLVRADDMLALQLLCQNLALDTSRAPPVLTRVRAQDPAFVTVMLRPQHLDEGAIDDIPNGHATSLLGTMASTLANASRLVFRLPDNVLSVPLTVADLLNWLSWTPSLAANAGDPPPTPTGPAPSAPSDLQTAIELPYRLLLSPPPSGRWRHAVRPVTREDRTELWHTRLGSPTDERVIPPVRAIWTRDLDVHPPAPLSDHRQQIVRLTSDFTLPHPTPLEAHNFLLTSAGASADLTGAWNPGPATPELNLLSWRDQIALGRDQYVQTTVRGFLHPFGHSAAMVRVTERKLITGSDGSVVEILTRRDVIVVNQPVRDFTAADSVNAYPHQGRETPFRTVTLKTRATPPLAGPLAGSGFPVCGDNAPGAPYLFGLVGQDAVGRTHHFSMPLMFVTDASTAAARYAGAAEALRTAAFAGGALAFAPGAELAMRAITFASVNAASLAVGALPSLAQAQVSLPGVAQLLGTAGQDGAVQMRLHDLYLAHGFDTAGNPSEVLGKFTAALPFSIPAQKIGLVAPSLPLDGFSRSLGPVAQTDALAGGAAQYLQRLRDALDGDLLGGIKLRDVIDLATGGALATQVPKLLARELPDAVTTSFTWSPDIAPNVDANGNPLGSGPPAPIITTRNEADASKSTQLVITATASAPLNGAEPSYQVTGRLTNFGLNLIDVVVITFGAVTFHVEHGKKPDLSAETVNVEFVGPLAFVNDLAELLPSDGFSDPPAISVTPDGIAAGYTLAVPSAGVGAFSLENIAISAQLTLPFAAPVGLRLSFSERFHPFLVTLSLVGGGGYLSVSLSTHGIDAIEGSLELGGNVTVSLGIVEANAHVMMGFYFGLRQDASGKMILDFIAYIRIGASVDLLGIVGISIDMYLGLGFVPKPAQFPGALGMIHGVASLTVGVHLLFVEKSVTLTFERSFVIPARGHVPVLGTIKLPILSDPPFDQMLTPDDWSQYCAAFA